MNRVREAVERIKEQASRCYIAQGYDGGPSGDSLHDAIDAALLACDEANERAEAAGAEWTKARDAWHNRANDYKGEHYPILDAYFATKNTDTNRVCPTCLHQYNDRVKHVCKKEKP